jgi:hypothetical protein
MRIHPRTASWAGPVLCLILAACGDGGPHSSGQTPGSSGSPSVTLLAGDGSATALSALRARQASKVAAGDVQSGYLLTRLLMQISASATVAQINTAAAAVGATAINSSDPQSALLTLVVPRQSSIAALWALARKLAAQSGIAFAVPGMQAKISVLPEQSPGVPVATAKLAHLLGNRFPQAWNARQTAPADCLPRATDVYVFDDFGDPSAHPDFASAVSPSTFVPDPEGPGPGQVGHGFNVSATLAGTFDASTPTGADPFADCTSIHEVEADGYDYSEAVRRLMARLASDPNTAIVLNSSVNFETGGFCGSTLDQACSATTVPQTPTDVLRAIMLYRVEIASEWARLAHAMNFESKVLIIQAVGNVDPGADDLTTGATGFLPTSYLGFRSASWSSPAALATHLRIIVSMLSDSTLWKSSDPALPDLTFDAASASALVASIAGFDPANTPSDSNLLLVDSGTAGAAPADIKQSDFDMLGAEVRAVGESVILQDADVASGGKAGTSFAAPLVAGTVAYLWNLAPALASQLPAHTIDLILASAQHTTNSPTVPVLDAYAAVLRLDDTTGVGTQSLPTPVRFGLLDANGDGIFDSRDLELFAAAYGLANPNTPSVPSGLDYSRFDLNGDGLTGGIPIVAFDLDVNGLDAGDQPRINTTDESIEDYTITFNEAALSDLQILCYYAYSPLYFVGDGGANAADRTHILGPDHCVRATIHVPLPGQISGATAVTTTVTVPAGNGQFAPAPNASVDFTTTCGTSAPASGTTDANGQIQTTVTPAVGCVSVTVQAVARGDASGPILAQQSVTATVTPDACSQASLKQLHFFLADATAATDPDQNFSTTAPSIGDTLSDATSSAFASVSYGTVSINARADDVDVARGNSNGVQFGGALGQGEFVDTIVVVPNDSALNGSVASATLSFSVSATPQVSGNLVASGWSVNSTFPFQIFGTVPSGRVSTVPGHTSGDPNGGSYSVTTNIGLGQPAQLDLTLTESVGHDCDPGKPCPDPASSGLVGSGSIGATLRLHGITVKDSSGNAIPVTLCSASGAAY